MKKVFSLALLFASANLFADGDTSNEPVAEAKEVVSEQQQVVASPMEKFFLELGVNVGAKNANINDRVSGDRVHMSYRFAFGGTVAPYYMINDKIALGLELGVNRSQSAKIKGVDAKFNVTHYTFLLACKYNLCCGMYAKLGLGLAHETFDMKGVNDTNKAKNGPAAKVAFGYNVWKNVDVELAYNYARVNGKRVKLDTEDFKGRFESHAISAGLMVRL